MPSSPRPRTQYQIRAASYDRAQSNRVQWTPYGPANNHFTYSRPQNPYDRAQYNAVQAQKTASWRGAYAFARAQQRKAQAAQRYLKATTERAGRVSDQLRQGLERGTHGINTRDIARRASGTPYLRGQGTTRGITHGIGPGLTEEQQGHNDYLRSVGDAQSRYDGERRELGRARIQKGQLGGAYADWEGKLTDGQINEMLGQRPEAGYANPLGAAERAEMLRGTARSNTHYYDRMARQGEERAKRNRGWFARNVLPVVSGAAGLPVLKQGLEGMMYLAEETQQAFYAGQYAQDNNDGSWLSNEGMGALGFVAGLPGLGFVAPGGSRIRKAVEATNSYEERAILTEQGELRSHGQRYFGLGSEGSVLYNVTSASGDLAFQFGTNKAANISNRATRWGLRAEAMEGAEGFLARRAAYLAPARALRRAGLADDAIHALGQAGRARFLAETGTGRSLRAGLHNVLRDNFAAVTDPNQIVKSVRGLSTMDAASAVIAGEKAGLDGSVNAILEAFERGTYGPRVTIRRQVAAGLGRKGAVGARGVPIALGPKTLKNTYRTSTRVLNRLARGEGIEQSAIAFASAETLVEEAGQNALIFSDTPWPSDFWAKHYGEKATTATPSKRFQDLFDVVDDWKLHPSVPIETAEHARQLIILDGFRLDELVRAGLADQVEARLRKMEVLVGVLEGKAGTQSLRSASNGVLLGSAEHTVRTGMETILDMARAVTSGFDGSAKFVDGLPQKQGLKKQTNAERYALKELRGESLEARQRHVRHSQKRLNGAHGRAAKWERANPVVPGVDRGVNEAAEDVQFWTRELHRTQNELDEFWEKQAQALRVENDAAQERIAHNAQLKVSGYGPDGFPKTPAKTAHLDTLIKGLPPHLQAHFSAALVKASANDAVVDLFPLLRQVDELLNNPTLRLEAERQATRESTRMRMVDIMSAWRAERSGLDKLQAAAMSPFVGGSKVVLSLLESVPWDFIPFDTSQNPGIALSKRVEGGERHLAALGFDHGTRVAFARHLAAAGSPAEIHDLIHDAYVILAARNGIAPDALTRAWASSGGDVVRPFSVKQDSLVDKGEGWLRGKLRKEAVAEPITDRLLQSQEIMELPLLNPERIQAIIRAEKATNPLISGARLNAGVGYYRARTGLSNAYNAAVPGTTWSVKKALRGGHSFWKFAVVTNLPAAAAGFAAGAIWGGDQGENGTSIGERFQWGIYGLVLGGLGSVRYIGRVVGIEERLVRYTLVRGNNPLEWVPGLSRWWSEHGVDRPFTGYDEIHQLPSEHNLAHTMTTEGQGWIVVSPKQTRYVDAWWRVVNHQINPETDFVMQALMKGRVGIEHAGVVVERETSERFVQEWLTHTDDGKAFLNRLARGEGGRVQTPRQVIDNYQAFIDDYMPHEDIIIARLGTADLVSGEVSRQDLKTFMRRGDNPAVVHAKNTWSLPRNGSDLMTTIRQLPARMTLERPTAKIAREPMARHFYKAEYLRMRRIGVPIEEAGQAAEEIAIRRTNEAMFRISDESRFAAKVDFLFPFQQPREEMLRVYAGMVARNPGRTVRAARLLATGFNNGAESGMFVKDSGPGGDSWTMRVPGSAWLSRVLGGPTAEWSFKLKDAFFFFRGSHGTSSQAFDTEHAGNLLLDAMPAPGGPYWSVLARYGFDAFPGAAENLMTEHRWIYDRIFPYGVQGRILRPEAQRLWMALSGWRHAPWEFASRWEQENELRRWEIEAYKQLRWEYVQGGGDDPDWTPDIEEVKGQMRGLMLAWTIIGSTVPAPSRPEMGYTKPLQEILERYKDGDDNLDYGKFVTEHPELSNFLSPTTEWTGPNDYDHWALTKEERNVFDEYTLHHRRRFSVEAFDETFKEGRRIQQIKGEYFDAWNNPNVVEREQRFEELRTKYPDHNPNSYYEQVRDLSRILNTVPEHAREGAVNAWRRRYDVSYSTYLKTLEKAEEFATNPWSEARDMTEVRLDVRKAIRDGFNAEWYVAQLAPAEQVRWYTDVLSNMQYYDNDGYGNQNDPQAVMDQWNNVKARISAIYSNNPRLTKGPWRSKPNPIKAYLEAWEGDTWEAINGITQEIYGPGGLSDAITNAYNSKDWTTWRALKDRRTGMFDMLRELKNKQYESMPDLYQFQDDLIAFVGLDNYKGRLTEQVVRDIDPDDLRRLEAKFKEFNVPFLPSNEQAKYEGMTAPVRRAYVDTLITSLNVPNGDYDFHIDDRKTGKLFWGWLTNFQRDLLKRNMPAAQIELWMGEDPNSTSNSGGYRRPNYYRSYGGGGSGNPALDWAYSLFKQYSKRPDGAQAPAAYKEYLNLPNDPALRRQFLDKHPEVQRWVSLGPMANMPPILGYIVADIMIRNGKWEGESKDMSEITELAWASEQFARYNQRGDMTRPRTYDLWLRMPSGQAKAEYLRAHPEIGRWLQLGPMANMPEAYKSVVRDIMMRYGQWTSSQDALGKLLDKFYGLPSHARDGFLERHPELIAYFDALRSPEEQRMQDLVNHYYSLPESTSKAIFLQSHPELQTYFIESRTSRYENFLNQVAQYMGSNPKLFQDYLDRQEDVLHELIRKFGEVPLLKEQYMTGSASNTEGRSESGRVRGAA